MAKTYSKMLELGTPLPNFRLQNTVDSTWVDSAELPQSSGYLIAFICNHCPYVIHIEKQLAAVCQKFSEQGIYTLGISANDPVNYPDDAPDKMREKAMDLGYTFPYLFDESQKVAQSFHAVCTPEFYLFDADKKLVYLSLIHI